MYANAMEHGPLAFQSSLRRYLNNGLGSFFRSLKTASDSGPGAEAAQTAPPHPTPPPSSQENQETTRNPHLGGRKESTPTSLEAEGPGGAGSSCVSLHTRSPSLRGCRSLSLPLHRRTCSAAGGTEPVRPCAGCWDRDRPASRAARGILKGRR